MPSNALLRFDSIQIIQSLAPGELQTGRILFEEVEPIALNSRPSVACRFTRVQTRDDLLQRLESIAADARANHGSPVLQFEMHGSADGVSVASGEFVSWTDLKEPLTLINQTSRLNLLVVLAACEGANLMRLLQPTDRAPVLAVIGPRHTISAGALEKATLAFYRTLFAAGDAAAAWRAMNTAVSPSGMTFAVSTAEFMLRYVMHHYLRTEGTEAALDRRQDRLEAHLRAGGMPEQAILMGREPARELMRDHRKHFLDIKRHFLFCDLFPENEARFGVSFEDCLKEPGEM